MHMAFGQFIAEQIGWPNSRPQNEVAFANLTIGILGLSGFWRRRRDYLWASIVAYTSWFFADGFGHVFRWLSSPMMFPPMLEQSCSQIF